MTAPAEASDLRTLLVHERKRAGKDFDRSKDRWLRIGKLRAKVDGNRGREIIVADQREAVNNVTIVVRHGHDVHPEDRLRSSEGVVYNVTGVRDWESRGRWEIIDAIRSWK